MRFLPALEPALAAHMMRLMAKGVPVDDELEDRSADAIVDWLVRQAQGRLTVPAWCEQAVCAAEVAMLWQAFGLTWSAERHEAVVRAAEELRSVRPGTCLLDLCLRAAEEALMTAASSRDAYTKLRSSGFGRQEAALRMRS